MKDNLDRLAEFVAAHGFAVAIETDGDREAVHIQIPWIQTDTGERGYDVAIVHNLAEARDALGY